MKIDPRARKIAVFGSLALTIAAVRWVDGESEVPRANAAPTGEAAAASLPSNARASAPKPDSIALDLTRLKRSGAAPKAVDAFGAKNWNPPPRKLTPKEVAAQQAVVAPPPPPPQAPPLPFTYVGMVGDEDETTVFLAQQDVNHAVKKGDVINGTYRVEEAEAGRVVLTYLPLDQRQTLTARTQ
jgi:hypothetical protein